LYGRGIPSQVIECYETSLHDLLSQAINARNVLDFDSAKTFRCVLRREIVRKHRNKRAHNSLLRPDGQVSIRSYQRLERYYSGVIDRHERCDFDLMLRTSVMSLRRVANADLAKGDSRKYLGQVISLGSAFATSIIKCRSFVPARTFDVKLFSYDFVG
jgi:hypothetical protein